MEKSLEELTLNSPINKYDMILLARRWAYELRSKEGETHSLQELIALAVRDVVTSNVSHKMIRELPVVINKNSKKPKDHTAMVLAALRATSESESKESSK